MRGRGMGPGVAVVGELPYRVVVVVVVVLGAEPAPASVVSRTSVE